jgi:hypothetical protein
MQPSSGGFFSIQFFSTEAAAFVMPILFSDCCEYTWYPCASHMFFDELCCFYAAAMLLVTHRHPISGAGIIGQTVVDVPIGHSLTPLKETEKTW